MGQWYVLSSSQVMGPPPSVRPGACIIKSQGVFSLAEDGCGMKDPVHKPPPLPLSHLPPPTKAKCYRWQQ